VNSKEIKITNKETKQTHTALSNSRKKNQAQQGTHQADSHHCTKNTELKPTTNSS
jgi:hypothetical protein